MTGAPAPRAYAIFAVVLVIAAGYWLGEPNQRETPAESTPTPLATNVASDSALSADALQQSARQFATFCAACHGREGEGVASLGPAILTANYLASRQDSTILRIITYGVPGTSMMAFVGPRFGQLSAAEAEAMVRWMRKR